MRRLLGVLHARRRAAELAPQPTLAAARRAASSARRAAGLPVELRVERRARARCPPALDLAAYRVVQEALTNALKHGGGARRGARALPATTSCGSRSPTAARRRDAPRARAAATGWSACASACALYRRRAAGRAARRRRLRGRRATAAQDEAEAALAAGARATPWRRRGMSVRILIADDQALVRAGFRMILDAEDDLEVVGEAGDGLQAVDMARRAEARRRADGHPHARARRHRGDAAARRRRRASDPTRVLMLTTFDLNEYVYEALRAGASGFLLKDVPPEQLAAGIRVVAARRGAARALDHAPADRGVRRGRARDREAAAGPRRADRARARGLQAASRAGSRTPRSPPS